MPSSRASSPLSSATPSPRLGHIALPRTEPGPSRPSSPRTSETEPLSDSDLTDPDEEEEEEETIEVMKLPDVRRRPMIVYEDEVDEEGEDGEKGDGDEEDEEDEEDEQEEDEEEDEGGPVHSPTRLKLRVLSDALSDTASLSPPPPSTKFVVNPLPVNSSPNLVSTMNGNHAEEEDAESAAEEEEEDTKHPEEVVAVLDIQEDQDDLEDQPAEDEDEDGDVTMRPPEDPDVPIEQHGLLDGMLDIPEPEVTIEVDDMDQQDAEEAEDQDGEVEGEGDAEAEAETTEANATVPLPFRPPGHVHSSHAPLPSSAAMRSLLMLELKFAALRDKLYLERMEEAAAEEEMLLNGTHPALKFIYKTLSGRREKLHEVASRRHEEALAELKRTREAEKTHVWSWWTEKRDRMHWDEFEETWSKRRRLAREKNEIETPRIVKPIPRAGGRSLKSFDWSGGAAPAKMSSDEAARDLALMDPRRTPQVQHTNAHAGPSRHASPAVYIPPAPPAQLPQEPPAATTPTSSAVPQSTESTPARRGPIPPNQPPPTFPYNHLHHAYNQRQSPVGASRVVPPQPQAQAQPQQPRSQGRTVPTTSDMFESKPPANPWADKRQSSVNGHVKEGLAGSDKPSASDPPRQGMSNRYPTLADYLGRPGAGIAGTGNGMGGTVSVGAGYGMMGPGTKALSPPKAGPGMLGGLNGRSPFASQSPSATPAGTGANRS